MRPAVDEGGAAGISQALAVGMLLPGLLLVISARILTYPCSSQACASRFLYLLNENAPRWQGIALDGKFALGIAERMGSMLFFMLCALTCLGGMLPDRGR